MNGSRQRCPLQHRQMVYRFQTNTLSLTQVMHNSETCHPRCVYKLIDGGIKSITQQVYIIMFIRG